MSASTRFWDRIAARYDNTSDRLNAYRQQRLDHMTRFLKSEDTVLDFACGTGRLALDLAPYVADVRGIDFSPGMIAHAQAKLVAGEGAPANVRFDVIDLFDGSLDAQGFNVVTAFNVFHLLDAPVRYLERIRQLLGPGGLLLTETPCLGHRPWYFRTALAAAGLTPLVPRLHFLTDVSLAALVTAAGFDILEAKRIDPAIGDPWVAARRD